MIKNAKKVLQGMENPLRVSLCTLYRERESSAVSSLP